MGKVIIIDLDDFVIKESDNLHEKAKQIGGILFNLIECKDSKEDFKRSFSSRVSDHYLNISINAGINKYTFSQSLYVALREVIYKNNVESNKEIRSLIRQSWELSDHYLTERDRFNLVAIKLIKQLKEKDVKMIAYTNGPPHSRAIEIEEIEELLGFRFNDVYVIPERKSEQDLKAIKLTSKLISKNGEVYLLKKPIIEIS